MGSDVTWQEMAKAGRKITAVKMYREETNCGLKDAYDHVGVYLLEEQKAKKAADSGSIINPMSSSDLMGRSESSSYRRK